MKTKHILLAAVLAATSAVQAATAEHKLPAPLPEFQTPEQLAKWRKEVTAKAAAADAQAAKQTNSAVFYTGKPYVEETESYSFRFRNYDPELNRWTTVDPSGYPDGSNNHIYVKNSVLNLYDPNGFTSEDIHENLSSTVFGITISGAWDGAFVYSFAHNAESASITPGTANDGFTGFTGVPLTVNIGGVTLGVGFRTDAIYYNKSSLNTKTENGIQWKQYVVDLEVKFKKTITIGVDVTSDWMGSSSCYKEGDWYE